MTRKEILNVLENEELPKLRDFIFEFVDQNRERWYRITLKKILEEPKEFKFNASTPLGIMSSIGSLIDIRPIKDRIKGLNGFYGQEYSEATAKKIKEENNNRSVKYKTRMTSIFEAQQILFYDDKETFLSVQIRVKIKNRWFLFILEEDNIEIVRG
jgi:RecB family exonuclease